MAEAARAHSFCRCNCQGIRGPAPQEAAHTSTAVPFCSISHVITFMKSIKALTLTMIFYSNKIRQLSRPQGQAARLHGTEGEHCCAFSSVSGR